MTRSGARAPEILRLDHLVLTCAEVSTTVDWYGRVLEFRAAEKGGRWALTFGQQKINLHQKEREIEPHAMQPTPGAADLCFITEAPLEHWLEQLRVQGVLIVEGSAARSGVLGPCNPCMFAIRMET